MLLSVSDASQKRCEERRFREKSLTSVSWGRLPRQRLPHSSQRFPPIARLEVALLNPGEASFQLCRPGRFAVSIEVVHFQAQQEAVGQGGTLVWRHGEKIFDLAHRSTEE